MKTALLILIGLGVALQSGEPKVIRKVDPRFPPLARLAGARTSGVQLSVRVSPDGRVEDVRIVQGQPLFNEAAVQAVLRWRFEATPLGGIVAVTVPFQYGPGRAVTGRVVDSAGRPLTGFRITAIQHGYEYGRRIWRTADSTDRPALLQLPSENATSPGQTDDRGVYRIFGLAPGEYHIRATYDVTGHDL